MSQRVKGAAIGIDLGTTYSCAGIWFDEQNRVEIIPNEQGNKITPSFIAFNDTELLVGEGAKNQIAMNPTNTVFDVKRLIGSSFSEPQVLQDMKLWLFKIIEGPSGKPNVVVNFKGEKKKNLAPEELSGMVLKKMKEVAESFIGTKVTDAVITVPAYFNNKQREATLEAGIIAGLNVLRLLNEPTAAAIAYGVNSCKTEDKEKNILVFDLGGGTFDVSLLKVGITGVIDVKAVGGDTHLGGEDFDMSLVKHCINEFWKIHNKNMRQNHRALARLKVACEKAKRDLSSTTLTSIDIDCLYMGIDFSTKISRAKFEELNLTLFNKCIELVVKCLNDGKMHKKEVDEVVVVGGSSRIPRVQKMLEDFFDGKALCKSMNGDEAVAFGAAILAAKLSSNDDIDNDEAKEKKDVVLQDVTPLSLGIEVRNITYHMNVGMEVQNPATRMDVIIPRNTCIPTIITKGYHPIFNTSRISVYQGESINVKDNIFLGDFTLFDLTLGPDRKSQLEVCFSIDLNGILQVTAEEISTGKRKSITIHKTIYRYNSLANPNLRIPKVKKERV